VGIENGQFYIKINAACVAVVLVSSSEMTRWVAAFSPASKDDEDEALYDERNG